VLSLTENAGASWSEITANGLPNAPIAWLGFSDPLHGAALLPLGDTPAPSGLFVTADGGHTWTPASISTQTPIPSAEPAATPS
jgi:photosystem II stability/assembly factor-like uncharacterized protein